LILGAGEMAELALRHLVDDGRSILVQPQPRPAVALAEQFHGRAVTFERFTGRCWKPTS
jgi:glutamyl-tRNA reductase